LQFLLAAAAQVVRLVRMVRLVEIQFLVVEILLLFILLLLVVVGVRLERLQPTQQVVVEAVGLEAEALMRPLLLLVVACQEPHIGVAQLAQTT
jgi:hypothetical protein